MIVYFDFQKEDFVDVKPDKDCVYYKTFLIKHSLDYVKVKYKKYRQQGLSSIDSLYEVIRGVN